ncbi:MULTISPECIES: BTAD domain-containing putative transcriptional regulator [unclassified Actinomadura]|uniref:AfsR/SARP family transcriptional regulator n=1 Tax=unclassified Actinomadura TaxID=2626254 RepID=UPI0013577CF0|nr:BTAD domain-containing putative transcriptional regulator [Actinomadura sp. K4S16]
MPNDLPAPRTGAAIRTFDSIEVRDKGRALPLGGPTHQAVLAHLVISEGWIARGALVSYVWDGKEEPLGADEDLQRKVRDVRKVLEAAGFDSDVLETVNRGYWLKLPRVADFQLFRDHAEHARRIAGEAPAAAADQMAGALDHVAGTPLPGLAGTRAEAFRQRLLAERAEARRLLELWSLQAGREEARVPLLREALAEDPYDQVMAGYLMYALAKLGRSKEALSVHDAMLDRLTREGLPIDPRLTAARDRIRDGGVGPGTEAPAPDPAPAAAPGKAANHHHEYHRIKIAEGGTAQFGVVNNFPTGP